jgi:hypothetical protein
MTDERTQADVTKSPDETPENPSNHNDDREPLTEEVFHSWRQRYDSQLVEMSGRYDKWILTLSGGALALSITFIEKIAPEPTPASVIWLQVAWALLVLAMLTGLISLMTSQQAIRQCMKELDDSYQEDRPVNQTFPKGFSTATNILNWASAFLFCLGVAAMCWFSFVNMNTRPTTDNPRGTTMTEKKPLNESHVPSTPPPSKVKDTRGLVPSSPPPTPKPTQTPKGEK